MSDDGAGSFEEQWEARKRLLAAVDAIPADKVVNIAVTKGDIALLIRSQASLFKAVADLADEMRSSYSSSRAAMVRMDVTRARHDFDLVSNALLQRIVEQENG
ncbi:MULTISPECIES: hypothetical protein [unclassified Aurantimonas]|uniref:hypothetical protein n=1 Tax=unclassified Aurantimonas TaxID=2638230 RepID=UPI002E16D410|nr:MULTISPECIES: hypothetical protein [unclassified Aurantimonas]MEC5289425.1 hypothetical protein [Aurantimonas sp. C2-3-R2]MEC5410505.1 hypothetical protein [Aurantimonas sp. C2-4-R8]